jgi:RNA polymerase-binding transcription factor DksA
MATAKKKQGAAKTAKKKTPKKARPAAKPKGKKAAPVKKVKKKKPAGPALKKKKAPAPKGKPAKKPAVKTVKAKPVQKKKAPQKAKPSVKPAAQSKPAPPKKPAVGKEKKQPQPSPETNVAPAKFVLPPLPQKPTPTYTPMKQRPDVMVVPKSTESSNKKRYSDSELREFQQIILAKLTDARRELANLQASLLNANDHGTDDTATTFKMLEDGSDSLAKEEAGQLAARQRKFIEQLENALVRIENKTYGVCRVTGKLIPKERLRAVPHTTQSIEAKAQQYRD